MMDATSRTQGSIVKVINGFKDLSPQDKIIALDNIIDACEPAELKYLSDRLSIFLKRDFVRFLPNEVCMYLLSWLDPISLARCCSVSKTWNEAVSACQPAWTRACRAIGWKVDDSITSGQYWKRTYERALMRIKQLKNGSAFKEGFLAGHAARVYTVKFNGQDLLASGSDDHTVRLWDVTTGECLRTIQTHTCADLAFDAYFVYTASFDNTVASWKWDTGDLVRSYRGHTGAVFSISYVEEHDLLVSGSADKTVRLWQLSTGEPINMYHGHREWVTKVILQKSTVDSLHHKPGDFVILSMDKIVIKIWLISHEVNCESLCELSATDYVKKSRVFRTIPSYPTGIRGNEGPTDKDHCLLHPQLLFDGSRIMCSSERGVLEWDFKDYTLTRVTPYPNDPCYLLGAGKTMLFAADACNNCLFIKMHGTVLENRQYGFLKNGNPKIWQTGNGASPEAMDCEQDISNNPCTSSSLFTPYSMQQKSSLQPQTDSQGVVQVTPTDESVEFDSLNSQLMSQDDEVVNDINFNSIKTVSKCTYDNNHVAGSENQQILGQWKLPLCRWSKRGSNYVCGDQSWLNGFSDINHLGLVFAAALPNHSIYILRWSDCT